MITEPPSDRLVHQIRTLLPEFEVVRGVGVEGILTGIIAPLPGRDAAEVPMAFIA